MTDRPGFMLAGAATTWLAALVLAGCGPPPTPAQLEREAFEEELAEELEQMQDALDDVPRCDEEPRGQPPRFRPRDTMVGLSQDQLLIQHGLPVCRLDGERWIYHFPRGCAYERAVVTVWLVDDRVIRETAVHDFTGRHCESIDGEWER